MTMESLLQFVPLIQLFPLVILFDYHQKENIHKAILFAAAVYAGMFLLRMGVAMLGFNMLYLLPLIPCLVFLLCWLKPPVNKRPDDLLD